MGEGISHQGHFLYTRPSTARDYKPAIFRSVLSHGADLHRCVTRQQHSHFFCLGFEADPRFAFFGLVDDPIRFRGEFEGTGEASPAWRGFFCLESRLF